MSEVGYKERPIRQADKKNKHQRRALTIKIAKTAVVTGIAVSAGLGALEVVNAGADALSNQNYQPNEVAIGSPVEIQTGSVFREEPYNPLKLDATQGDNKIDANGIEIKGLNVSSLKGLEIKNALSVKMPNGENWFIIQGANVNGKTENVYVEASDPKVKHSLDRVFNGLFTDDNGEQYSFDENGQRVTDFNQITPLTKNQK